MEIEIKIIRTASYEVSIRGVKGKFEKGDIALVSESLAKELVSTKEWKNVTKATIIPKKKKSKVRLGGYANGCE